MRRQTQKRCRRSAARRLPAALCARVASVAAATTLAGAATLAATTATATEPPTPQETARGWVLTGQAGAGLTFVFGEQVPDPSLGFSIGRYLTDGFEVAGQLIGFAGPARTTRRETSIERNTPAVRELREQRRSALALTRVNLFLGNGRWRPYFAFGAGLGWGRERLESRILFPQASGAPVSDGPGTTPSPSHTSPTAGFDRVTRIERVGFATLLGTGIDVALNDRWSVRPEVSLPFVWNGVESGNVTMVVGFTYATAPPPRLGDTLRARRGSDTRRAPADLADWSRVVGLPPTTTVRISLAEGAAGVREGGTFATPDAAAVVGTFIAADDQSIVVRAVQGADRLVWRFSRGVVEAVESGRLDADPPWEGILSGLVVGAGIGAIGYLGSGGGDDHEIWIPVGTALFGGPMALAGGLLDHFHRSFAVDGLVYRRPPES